MTITDIELVNQSAKKKKLTFRDMPGFDITSQEMLSIIDPAVLVVQKKPAFVALEMMTVVLKGNELSVKGVDINSAQVISRGTVTDVYGNINVAVPATQLSNLIRSMKNADIIQFRHDSANERLIVKTSKSTYKLPVHNGEIPYISDEELAPLLSMSFPPDLFSQNLQRIVHCAARNDVRYYMNGILMQIKNNMLYMVATDGHRMATTKDKITVSDNPELSESNPSSKVDLKGHCLDMILPISVCPILQKILKGQKERVKVDYCSQHLIFETQNIRAVCNLVAGKYPHWENIAGNVKKFQSSYTASLLELKETMSRAVNLLVSGSTTKESQEKCLINFSDGDIVISSPSTNTTECEEILAASRKSGEGDYLIGMNGQYLLDAINGCINTGCEEVEILVIDATSAIYLSTGETLDIVMPLRL